MAKKLFYLVIFALLSVHAFAASPFTRREIKMHVEKKIDHRSATIKCPVQAFINGAIVEIDMDYPIDNLSVSIVDIATGETVYYNTQTTTEALTIDLSGRERESQYVIVLSAASNLVIQGEFTLN